MPVLARSLDPQTDRLLLEQLKVKELHPEITLPQPKPLSHYDLSSIKGVEAAEAPAPQFRPQLEHPARPLARVYEKAEASGTRQAQHFDTTIRTDLETVNRLNDEKELAIREFIEREQSKKTWGILTTIFQYLATASTIFLGIAAIATGQVVPGALMVAGAGGALAHRVAVVLNLYHAIAGYFTKSAEVQDKIARRIEMVAFAATLITSFIGGIMAFNAGVFGNTEKMTAKLSESLPVGLSIMSGGFRLKEAHLQKQIAEIQSRAKLLEAQVDSAYWNIDANSKFAKQMAENLAKIGKQLRELIRACIQAGAPAA